jgi:hypothetical protein
MHTYVCFRELKIPKDYTPLDKYKKRRKLEEYGA